MGTKIEYVDESINPIRTKEGGWHCVKTSMGCENCYAERINNRFGDKKPYTARKVELVLNQNALDKPKKWKKPKRIFVQDMSDLFLEDVPSTFINNVFRMMMDIERHIFIILTKRPERMSNFLNGGGYPTGDMVPPNIWLGVSCEDQEQADRRIPILLQIPAAIRFISVEPMLGPVDLSRYVGRYSCYNPCCGYRGNEIGLRFDEDYRKKYRSKCKKYGTPECEPCGDCEDLICPKCESEDYFGFVDDSERISDRSLDWVVCGGESGRKASPMYPDWARKLRDDCVSAGVPFFFKQHGEFVWRPTWGHSTGRKKHTFSDGVFVEKVGKKKAGRLLDGETWDQMPGE